MSVIADLTHLDFSLSMDGSGSAGSFYKAYDTEYYYKTSLVLPDGFCYESVNEVLASRVAELMNLKNARYELIHAKIRLVGKEYTTYICKSRNYKRLGEGRITLEGYMFLHNMQKGNLQDLEGVEFFNDILNTMLFDYMIDNRDRHGANFEVLIGKNYERLSPIFDCGSSLLAPCQYDWQRIDNFELLHNGPVNNFLVSMFWEDILVELRRYNLKVKDICLEKLQLEDLYKALDRKIVDKGVAMIKERYNHAKKVLNS